ncbi:ATP-binding protein, partial [Spirosoma sp. RP8]
RQELKIRDSSEFLDNPDKITEPIKWDLDIEVFPKDIDKCNIEIKKFDRKKIKSKISSFESLKESDFNKEIKEFILAQNPLYQSIARSIYPVMGNYSFQIESDLKGGETFNIVPGKVRELEDSATPPGIKKDGSGLATTLYAMKKSRSTIVDNNTKFWYMFEDNLRTYDPGTLIKIISYLKAANATITSLDVDNDPFNNKLRVQITVDSGGYKAVLPLSSMSDGTVKWLALITAILTSKTIFSIEEPENFLHPWMQAEITSIMRDHLQEKKADSLVLMTTHSESILNHAYPEEIIIVDLVEGKTKARRISNILAIKEEISNSGFGLGHFYFSNALVDE